VGTEKEEELYGIEEAVVLQCVAVCCRVVWYNESSFVRLTRRYFFSFKDKGVLFRSHERGLRLSGLWFPRQHLAPLAGRLKGLGKLFNG